MPFRLHQNLVGESPPYVLVIQRRFLDDVVESRVVVPVHPLGRRPVIPDLDPPIIVIGEPHVAVVSDLVAVPRRYLGSEVPYTGHDDDDVKRCLDRLFFGI